VSEAATPVAAAEAIELCRDLLRIDTTNTGNEDTTAGERRAAEYVAGKLAEVGLTPEIREARPGRTNVVARFEGTDPARDALLVHGHLDVVPAEAHEWSVHPFAGEIRDGYLWGRGAVDMKNFDAMVLAVVRDWRRRGVRPPRDLVLAFTADEEAGSDLGASFLVREHPDLFHGCTEAIGEVGGFSYTINGPRPGVAPAAGTAGDADFADDAGDGQRIYLVATAEKGVDWLRLRTRGRPGHGSMVHTDNAVTVLAEVVARVGRHRFPVELTPTVRAFLTQVCELLRIDLDPQDPEAAAAKLGPIAPLIGATLRDTANPTRLAAGYKDNVIPSSAIATIDCRTLPGHTELFLQRLREVVGDEVEIEYIHRQPGIETSFEGPLADAISAAVRAEDPCARIVPYMLSAGTDAKAFSTLGIRCFGCVPLRLPPDLDFASLFHGVDERVPLEGLQFGVRVLDRLLSLS
jgi:acetylornithine deacetylase/succinyl-diaminopimelate desuccinylase-like protein